MRCYYDDCGLLVPAHTSTTGYRLYAREQRERGTVIRMLRDAGLSLAEVRQVVDAPVDDVRRVVREHFERNAEQARKAAAALEQALQTMLGSAEPHAQVSVPGPELASGIRQVRHAAARSCAGGQPDEGAAPTALQVEIGAGEVRLVATDRYRLALRSLRGQRFDGGVAQVVVGADDLLRLVPALLLAGTVVLRIDRAGLTCTVDGQRYVLAARPGGFPDYRLLLDGIAPADARLVADRGALLAALRPAGPDRVVLLSASDDGVAVVARPSVHDLRRVPGSWLGPRFEVAFDAAHLEEALAVSVGPDVIIELADGARPAVVRSADHGSFTTLVMPRRIPIASREPTEASRLVQEERHEPRQPGGQALRAGDGGGAGAAAG